MGKVSRLQNKATSHEMSPIRQGEVDISTFLMVRPGAKCTAVAIPGCSTPKKLSIHTHTILFSLGVQTVVHCFNNTVPVEKYNLILKRTILGQVHLGLNLQTLC